MSEASADLAKIEGVESLTGMQRSFVEALLSGSDVESAKKTAGYSDSTPTVGILSGKLVETAISGIVDARMRGDLKLKAMKTLENLMDSGPATMKLAAAREVLHWDDDRKDDAADKELGELSIAELERIIRQKEATLKDVTP